MIRHSEVSKLELKRLIRSGEIKFGGNLNLKIYGTLSCKSGKRMKKQNRVFFISENQAVKLGFRPCGHCLREKYHQWKKNE